ncbi:MAG: transcription termination/antitermination protein NusG [Bacilli bacterium]
MDIKKEWYVVNTISGHEYKVKQKLEMRIENENLQDRIFNIVIPEMKEIVVKDGTSKEKNAKMFPGYILIEMFMTDEAWYIIRNTQGVTGFIGSSGKGAKPFPLYPHEVEHILGNMKNKEETKATISSDINVGNNVRIENGPFSTMFGSIDEIIIEENKCVVNLDLFGQVTKVDIDLKDVKKI